MAGIPGKWIWRFLRLAAVVAALAACKEEPPKAEYISKPPREVVVYTALDREFSEPIFTRFTEKTGITVKPVYDTESVKTVGLVNRLLAEKARPVCDVFWNNEIVRSIQLKREGITDAYRSPNADSIPENIRDPEGHWTGFAARGRVILVNAEKLGKEVPPARVSDLADPRWKGRAAFAKPLFGTTATHAAVLWVTEGEEKAGAFWSA
ncbi:ABC transporter substrate-binding protein, partial [Candidatus Poribacteria bacterium]|nr:ABC transporter substrate-binding protein [Candidatus Poribacteria bacterium]